VTTEIDVMRDGELLVAGRLRHVCVSTETWQKTDLPEWVRGGLERFARAQAD
jgi:acyl-CoA thioesterase FadM